MKDVFALEKNTEIFPDKSYTISYPYLIEHFKNKSSLDVGDIVCGAHMAYGWMPTILKLHEDIDKRSFDVATKTLNEAKMGNEISAIKIKELASLINNSIVGASKLLHFVAPQNFPIWDSKIYSFVHEQRPHHYRVNNVDSYLNFIKSLRELTKKSEFPDFHASVQHKLRYDVTPMRSLELVMFLNAPVFSGKSNSGES